MGEEDHKKHVLLFIEFIVRLLLQPDPWLLSESYWYFYQPLRSLTEFTIVAIVFLILTYEDKHTLIIHKNQLKILKISSLACMIIFALLELDQLQSSFYAGIVHGLGNTITWVSVFVLL